MQTFVKEKNNNSNKKTPLELKWNVDWIQKYTNPITLKLKQEFFLNWKKNWIFSFELSNPFVYFFDSASNLVSWICILWCLHAWLHHVVFRSFNILITSIKICSYYTAIALRWWYIDYISAANHSSITAFQVNKFNFHATPQCSNIARLCSAATQHNSGVVWQTFMHTQVYSHKFSLLPVQEKVGPPTNIVLKKVIIFW